MTTPPLPKSKYKIIYADPPWSFRTWSKNGQGRAPEKHYPTMSKEDIFSLPVSDIAEDDCVLFLWATFPCLPQALETMTAWGFEYKTCAFTWVKRNKKSSGWFWGLGYWTRANAELCLLGTRGKPNRISSSVHSVVDEPITRHSEKPAVVRDKIVQLVGNVSRIELFARTTTEGWDCWGNEV